MNTPIVTVVVPGFDVADYVADALASLRAQTFTAWTAILVDDGSTDATGRLFDEAADADPRFRVVRHAQRRGLGAARNTALELIDTPYTAFLDADDVLTPTALERLMSTLTASGSDFAAGAYVRLRPDGAGGYRAGDVQPWVAAATSPERRATTLTAHPEASANIVAWSKLSRTALWRGVRFPEGRMYEDQIVAQLLYTRARAFDVIPDVVVHWRERADGSSITQMKDRLPVLRDYLDALAGGIDVLDAAGHAAAVRARVRLILDMDVPPLVQIAQGHPDDAYRRTLGAFVRGLWAGGPAARAGLSPDAERLVAAALLW